MSELVERLRDSRYKGQEFMRREAATQLEAKDKLIAELSLALDEQCDNMAFVLSRVDLQRWHEHFDTKIAERRELLRRVHSLSNAKAG